MSEIEIIVSMDKHIKIKGGHYKQDLVRCKDCKYYAEFSLKCNRLNLIPMHPDDFCSYAEERS